MNTADNLGSNVAFVFEGGGSLAATQIGMLRALTEVRDRPELVIGTSAGAINAVAFAANPTPGGVAQLEALWLSLRRRDMLRLRALLQDHFADRRLEDGQLPAHVVTTDLATGAAHVISTGPVVEALLASAVIPGLFPPVTIDGRHLVDGALVANTPVRQAEELGATDMYVLAVATQGDAGRPTTPAELAPSGLSNVLAGTAPHPQGSPARVRLIPAPASPTGNILDFRHSSQLMAESYQLTRQWLAQAEPVATVAA
jgi:NTE family protein